MSPFLGNSFQETPCFRSSVVVNYNTIELHHFRQQSRVESHRGVKAMNTRAKLTVVALFSVFALASNPARADVLGFSVALPDVSAVTAEVGKMVAADMT